MSLKETGRCRYEHKRERVEGKRRPQPYVSGGVLVEARPECPLVVTAEAAIDAVGGDNEVEARAQIGC